MRLQTTPFLLLFHIMLTVSLLLFKPAPSTAQTFSPAILEAHRLIKKHIPIDFREGVESARQSHPVVYALSLGWFMQRQKLQADQHKNGDNQVKALTAECKKDLYHLSNELTWSSSGEITPSYEKLLEAFNNAMSGDMNQWVNEKEGWEPEKLAIPYVADSLAPPEDKVQKIKPDIVLLDEKAVTPEPSLVINALKTSPETVPVNTPFKIDLSFTPDLVSVGPDTEIIFSFTISQNGTTLFRSKKIKIQGKNRTMIHYRAKMGAVPKAGLYSINAEIKNGELSAHKSASLKIE